MDGLRGVWHGGPFALTTRYVFYPRQIMFATDPVAVDRLLLDIIETERRAHGAISIWDRSPASLRVNDNRARDADPNVNIIIREPGHVVVHRTFEGHLRKAAARERGVVQCAARNNVENFRRRPASTGRCRVRRRWP